MNIVATRAQTSCAKPRSADAMGKTRKKMQIKKRARQAKRLEGMTLIEILIVVIIMAMIAGAVGVAVMPQFEKSQIKSTQTDAQSVRSAVQLFIIDNPGGCPSMEDLVEGGYVDKGKRLTDAWEQPFQVECDGTDVRVMSSGPDQQMGTEDDIQ